MSKDWEKVKEKFKHTYLRRLAILDHINELKVKHTKALIDDTCPFEQDYFNKELADLFILLQFHYEFDNNFAKWYEERKTRFVEKYRNEIKSHGAQNNTDNESSTEFENHFQKRAKIRALTLHILLYLYRKYNIWLYDYGGYPYIVCKLIKQIQNRIADLSNLVEFELTPCPFIVHNVLDSIKDDLVDKDAVYNMYNNNQVVKKWLIHYVNEIDGVLDEVVPVMSVYKLDVDKIMELD